LIQLTQLNGDKTILAKAAQVLPNTPAIQNALSCLNKISEALKGLDVTVSFDFSELRGYHYHSGIVFAAYAQGYKGPLALGGRYDEVGKAFGRARPATGFSLDLRGVVTALPPANNSLAIFAPAGNTPSLIAKITALRAEGQIVIQALTEADANASLANCDRKLEQYNSGWHVVGIDKLAKT
jgi:ATP phosphoribosyltransferase regulatory subunit